MYRALGVIPGVKDCRDYRLAKKAMASNFPPTYEAHSTSIKDQKMVGSCVAHSIAEILEAHYGTSLSTDFIYGNAYNLYGTRGPGMRLRDACKIVKEYGDCAWVFCDSNTEVDEVYNIAKKALNDETCRYSAAQHTISSYVKVSTPAEIKSSIMNHGPVLTAVMWYSDNKVKDGILVKGEAPEGGHCIIITGWNEKGWIIQNSWGSRWGCKGKAIMPYSYPIEEAYCLTFKEVALKKPIKCLNWLYKLINKVFK